MESLQDHRQMPCLNRPFRFAFVVLVFALAGSAMSHGKERYSRNSLAGQLQALASTEGFTVSGLDKLGDANNRSASGSGVQRVEQLLSGFDHVIIHQNSDRIERLIIIGRKRAAPPVPTSATAAALEPSGNLVLDTHRKGAHHLVEARLEGAASNSIELELMVDTGASLVVLPRSRHVDLGIELDGLNSRTLQTAKGKLKAQIGLLESVQLGTATIEKVEVAFVDDALLGQYGLLGMNVLGRFVFILDDKHSRLTLIPNVQPPD